jgi:hypothetical protein
VSPQVGRHFTLVRITVIQVQTQRSIAVQKKVVGRIRRHRYIHVLHRPHVPFDMIGNHNLEHGIPLFHTVNVYFISLAQIPPFNLDEDPIINFDVG